MVAVLKCQRQRKGRYHDLWVVQGLCMRCVILYTVHFFALFYTVVQSYSHLPQISQRAPRPGECVAKIAASQSERVTMSHV